MRDPLQTGQTPCTPIIQSLIREDFKMVHFTILQSFLKKRMPISRSNQNRKSKINSLAWCLTYYCLRFTYKNVCFYFACFRKIGVSHVLGVSPYAENRVRLQQVLNIEFVTRHYYSRLSNFLTNICSKQNCNVFRPQVFNYWSTQWWI